MPYIAGVDGCRTGWVAVLRDTAGGAATWERYARLEDLLASPYALSLAAIDIPLGLLDAGYRQCDTAARRLLPGRASSVFPAPIRPLLDAPDYATANALSREHSGVGLSRQSYGILAKVREADGVVRAARAGLLRESHPEMAFVALNKGLPLASKHRPEGMAQRRELLLALHGQGLERLEGRRMGQQGVGLDDLYDALALLETAERLARGTGCRVPEPPPVDTYGIPMEINFFRYDG